MKRNTLAAFAIACSLFVARPAVATQWDLVIERYGAIGHNRLSLDFEGEKIIGKMGRLLLQGTLRNDIVEFQLRTSNGTDAGTYRGTLHNGEMSGEGKDGRETVRWTARRIPERAGPPQHYRFTPTVFHGHFGSGVEPALRIFPGDSVETWSLDADGYDAQGRQRFLPGNPLTGPFYVEGAMPGDTLVVRLDRLRLNRESAGGGNRIAPSALDPRYFAGQKEVPDFDSSWTLDPAAGLARLAKPTEKLKDFVVQLKPMLGCIGVAPPYNDSVNSGDLGSWGGNMDYNEIVEGTTIHLPVSQAGALLYIGDGHAVQGDGELNGLGLETTMEVTFTVNVHAGRSVPNPRIESAHFRMASGIGGSLTEALQLATTNLARWLQDDYNLNAAEVGVMLGTVVRYDIAEVVDPHIHVVAKISKSVLAKLSKAKIAP